jgi:hypothetical protein
MLETIAVILIILWPLGLRHESRSSEILEGKKRRLGWLCTFSGFPRPESAMTARQQDRERWWDRVLAPRS